MSGPTQMTHHLSIWVSPTTSLVSLWFLCSVVLCVALAFVCMYYILTCHIVAQVQDPDVLPEAEKKVGVAGTPLPFSHHWRLLGSPHNFCVRGCIFWMRREVSQL